MKNQKKILILLILMTLLISYNTFCIVRLNRSYERTIEGLTTGGLALVENLEELLLFKASLLEINDPNVSDSIANVKLGNYFFIYQSVNVDSIPTFLLISKKGDDILYMINKDTVIYYDKIVYDINEKLKVGYRLKFDEWLHEGN